MRQAIPLRIQEQAQAAVSDWAAPIADAVAAGTLSIELAPWLAARCARREAERLFAALMDMEQHALAAAGLPSDLPDDGVDLDAGETLCHRCPEVIVAKALSGGGFLVTDRAGAVHRHVAPGTPPPSVVIAPQQPTTGPRRAPAWERWQ
jgi:hypothetical protein